MSVQLLFEVNPCDPQLVTQVCVNMAQLCVRVEVRMDGRLCPYVCRAEPQPVKEGRQEQ